jgi:hypothetical protein
MNPNTTWSGLLESYHPYLTPQKVSKNLLTYCVHSTLPKSAKSQFNCLRHLGINFHEIWSEELHYEKQPNFFLTLMFESYNSIDSME